MKLEDICFSYKKQLILSNVSLNIQPNTNIAIIGPSGCGKTTLLQIMAGMLSPDSGSVTNELSSDSLGKAKSLSRHTIGFVFQDARLLPWLSVYDNIELVAKRKLTLKKRGRRDVDDLLKKTGLFQVRNHYPYELSGGMRQRVGVARALSVSPSLLLMDEPFSSIDGCTRYLLHEELVELTSHYPCTKVLVTHQLDDIFNLADKAVLLSFAPTKVIEVLDIRALTLKMSRSSIKQMIWDKIKPFIIQNEMQAL